MLTDFLSGSTLGAILGQYYRRFPERTAIHLLHSQRSDQALTYGELIRGSVGYAQAFGKVGIRPGEVAIIIQNQSPHLVYAFFGAILAGVIPSIMPFLTEKLSPDQYRASLSALFEITQPAAAVTYREFIPEITQARGRNAFPRQILVSDHIQPCDSFDLDQMAGMRSAPQDIVLLQHSSGTTGLQKGVALSHQAIFNQLNAYAHALKLDSQDVIVSWLPLYHDMGLIAGFLLPILCGTPLVLMSPFDWVRAPHRLLQAISSFRGTLAWLPNFAYNFCAQKIRDRDLEGVDLSSWRAVINCSEPMYWSSHQMFAERFRPYGFRLEALATSYAMAENVFAVTQGGIDNPVRIDQVDQRALITQQIAVPASDGPGAIKMLSAGAPIANTRLRVLDPKGQVVPDRHIGEISIQSTCMLTGYFKRPDLTAKAFLDGWYLTGDLGYLADGELYITGRKKDLIIVGGKNIYPQDLERLAGDVAGVHAGRVVAFGVFNERLGTEDVVILAESDQQKPQLVQKIADEIRDRVTRGSDVALRYVKIVERGWLQKTSSGKIARSANCEKYLQEFH